MREYGISYDEGSGLPVGSYILHRRDGASMPTVFGSFAKGVCGPIKGTPASRLCMAIGHELSRVERSDEATGEVTVVWLQGGQPPASKTIDEEIATLDAEGQAAVHDVLDGKTPHCREELEEGARWFRDKGLLAIADAFASVAAGRLPAADVEPGTAPSGAALSDLDEATGETAEGVAADSASGAPESAPKRGRKKSREA